MTRAFPFDSPQGQQLFVTGADQRRMYDETLGSGVYEEFRFVRVSPNVFRVSGVAVVSGAFAPFDDFALDLTAAASASRFLVCRIDSINQDVTILAESLLRDGDVAIASLRQNDGIWEITPQSSTLEVVAGRIADGAVGTAQIADGAVTGAKVAANAIQNAHIANVAAGKVTTGTLPVVRGGTGVTSIAANSVLATSSENNVAPIRVSANSNDTPNGSIPRHFTASTGSANITPIIVNSGISTRVTGATSRAAVCRIQGGSSAHGGLSQLLVGTDAAREVGRYVRSTSFYSRTSTASSNSLRTTTSGTITRMTSARKYKEDIEDVNFDPELFLGLRPRTWIDKGMKERTIAALRSTNIAEGYNKSDADWYAENGWSLDTLPRITGLIAEEVEQLPGGKQFVEYGDDGTVEGLTYDRLIVAAASSMKYLQEKIETLESRIEALESAASNCGSK